MAGGVLQEVYWGPGFRGKGILPFEAEQSLD